MRAAAAVLLVLVLSGCASSTPTTGSSSPPSGSTTAPSGTRIHANVTSPLDAPITAFTLEGCTNYGAVFPTPMASAKAVLPDGFDPVPAANDPQGGATLYALALDCTGSSVNGNATGAVRVGYVEIAVTVPAKDVVDGITDATVPVFFAANSSAIGTALASFHLGLAGRADTSGLQSIDFGVEQTRAMNFQIGNARLMLTTQMAGPAIGSVAGGAFALYGVQDGKLLSILRGASTDGTARQGPALLQPSSLPVAQDARQAALGFSASGFTLSYERKPLPT